MEHHILKFAFPLLVVLIIIVPVVMLSGCAARMYGKLTCDGPCTLELEREIKELDPIPIEVKKEK